MWRALRLGSPWIRRFLQFAGKTSGADVTIKGDRLTQNVLYIANHVSWLDIAVLGGKTGTAFVAKADMADWPVLGWMATFNNSVYVSREQRRNAGAQAAMVQAALLTGQPLTLFPEGTTGDGRALLTFRSSLLAAVAPPPPDIAIQPVAIDYGTAAGDIAWTGDESVGENALRLMSRKERLAVTLHFMPAIEDGLLADRKTISARARNQIGSALGLG